MNRFVAAAVLVAAVSGCSSVNSGDVKTDAIQATFQAVSQGSGETVVNASLLVGSDYVKLTGGDTLNATDGTASSPFVELTSILNQTSFTATVADDTPGSSIVVAFTRSGNTSAPNSNVLIPTSFDITSPTSALTISRSGDLMVTWDTTPNATESISWAATGTCINNAGATAAAGAQGVDIPAGSLVGVASQMSDQSVSTICTVTLTVSRTLTGTTDPAFASGSSITAVQQRSVQFTSTT